MKNLGALVAIISPKIVKLELEGVKRKDLEVVIGEENWQAIAPEIGADPKRVIKFQIAGLNTIVDLATPRLMAVRVKQGKRCAPS